MGCGHAEGLDVCAEDEEEAAEDGGLDDSAWDGAEGVDSFVAERCGALEADEAEEGQDDAEADCGGRDSGEVELRAVDVESVVPEKEDDDDGDGENGESFDPEHEARGDLDVAIGDGGGCGDADQAEDGGGSGAAEEDGEEDVRVVDEASGDGCSCGDVSEKKSPTGDAADDWREA